MWHAIKKFIGIADNKKCSWCGARVDINKFPKYTTNSPDCGKRYNVDAKDWFQNLQSEKI